MTIIELLLPIYAALSPIEKAQYDALFEPVVVGSPPTYAVRDMCVMPDGEIRHYGWKAVCGRKTRVYASSRDLGLNWKLAYPGPDDTGPVPFTWDWPSHELRQLVELRKTKRLVAFFSDTRYAEFGGNYHAAVGLSDDGGKTWRRVPLPVVPGVEREGAGDARPHWYNAGCEPTGIELKDGTLLVVLRTSGPHVAFTRSHDGGETWDEPKVDVRFWAANTRSYLFRLSDGRILFVWNNTQILPTRAAAEYPELSAGELSGEWESVFTNRDALHAAISEDEGETWRGFREIALTESRNASDFRELGNDIAQERDKSVHQTQAIELPGGKVLIAYGQNAAARRFAIFDPNWLLQTSCAEDFRHGLGGVSHHLYVKSLTGSWRGWAGHAAWNRMPGAVMAREPDTGRGTAREAMWLARPGDPRLVSDVAGVLWNFPATRRGRLEIVCRVEGEGFVLSLNDHWINPCDTFNARRAPFTTFLPRAEIGTGWTTLAVEWDTESKEVSLLADGRLLRTASLAIGPAFGLSYLHLQMPDDRLDPKGTFFRSFSLSGSDEGFHAADLTPVSGETYGDGEIVLAEGGRQMLPIFACDAQSRRAGEWLADVLGKAAGVEAKVTVLAVKAMTCDRPGVWVMPRVKNGDGSFSVEMPEGRIVFRGDSPDYGLYDFCERVLGVRNFYYHADGLGLSVPKAPGGRVAFRRVSWRDRPVFERREIFPASVRREGATQKMGNNHLATLRTHVPRNWHTDTNFNYKVTNPEVLELASNGQRGTTPMLCYGSPQTLDEYMRRIDEEVSGGRSSNGICTPDRGTVTVCQWDAALNCHCSNCMRMADPKLGSSGSASPIIWGFFTQELSRRVHERHPDWKIVVLPYLNTCAVPAGLDFKLGNVEAMLCTMPGLAMLKNDDCRVREERLILDWEKATHNLVQNWHYLCWPSDFTCAPYVFGETIVGHYRRLRGHISGSFVDGAITPRHYLNAYVWARAMWNPDIDVQAVYDSYARRLFGAAAEKVRELVRMQERGWNRQWKTDQVSNKNIYEISYPRAEVVEMERLLGEARELAAGNSAVAARLAELAGTFAQFFAESEENASGSAFEPLKIQKVAESPVVDGRLDEVAWGQAAALSFADKSAMTNAANPGAELKAVWTPGKGVTFGLKCFEPEMDKLVRGFPPFAYPKANETVEFFVDPTGNGDGGFCQLIWDIANKTHVTSHDGKWSPQGIVTAVHEDSDFWSIEVFLPFAAFGGIDGVQIPTTAAGGKRWAGNVCRLWAKKGESLPSRNRWSRLYTRRNNPWNKDPAAFGPWIFVE